MRIALCSLNQRWLDKVENLQLCDYFVHQAKSAGCELIIFPEMTLTGYSLTLESVCEYSLNSWTLNAFKQLSQQNKVSIIFGAALQSSHLPANVFCFASVAGVQEIYSKLHPFSFVGEDRVFAPGDHLGFLNISGINLGANICYDLRFSVPFFLMAQKCTGVVCIANWPQSRVNHWRALLIARAIENQMIMIGVNRVGVDGNGLFYEKSSMVVLPNGDISSPISSSEELDIYDVDFAVTAKARQEFPTLRDGNFERYQELYFNQQ